MAKYNIYGHVLYSEIEYERLMYITERIFINALINRIPNIDKWTSEIWDTIDHEYMIQTLKEIEKDIIRQDYQTYLKFKDFVDNEEVINDIERIFLKTSRLPDKYKINPISEFKNVENKFANKISRAYKQRIETIDSMDEMEYLTKQIKNYHKLEQTIVYKNGRSVTPSTYLSMLYNVNLTRTGWNQTFKDAEYFEKDLMLLETHPNSCPRCAPMQRQSLF